MDFQLELCNHHRLRFVADVDDPRRAGRRACEPAFVDEDDVGPPRDRHRDRVLCGTAVRPRDRADVGDLGGGSTGLDAAGIDDRQAIGNRRPVGIQADREIQAIAVVADRHSVRALLQHGHQRGLVRHRHVDGADVPRDAGRPVIGQSIRRPVAFVTQCIERQARLQYRLRAIGCEVVHVEDRRTVADRIPAGDTAQQSPRLVRAQRFMGIQHRRRGQAGGLRGPGGIGEARDHGTELVRQAAGKILVEIGAILVRGHLPAGGAAQLPDELHVAGVSLGGIVGQPLDPGLGPGSGPAARARQWPLEDRRISRGCRRRRGPRHAGQAAARGQRRRCDP
jgi:hypothetical protein